MILVMRGNGRFSDWVLWWHLEEQCLGACSMDLAGLDMTVYFKRKQRAGEAVV